MEALKSATLKEKMLERRLSKPTYTGVLATPALGLTPDILLLVHFLFLHFSSMYFFAFLTLDLSHLHHLLSAFSHTMASSAPAVFLGCWVHQSDQTPAALRLSQPSGKAW